LSIFVVELIDILSMNKSILNRFIGVLMLLMLSFRSLYAEEGMLIPALIGAFESDMQAMGMKLTADEIYSLNRSSLKDAVMHFGGGCTAELVSQHGLLLTNHHCGYSQIQAHSSLENDYLTNGFWAKTKADELPNKDLTATRIVKIENVTNDVLFGISAQTTQTQRDEIITKNQQKIISEQTNGTHFRARIKAFNQGNEYYLLLEEVFSDVRLVGTPPNSIGKFGGDTDNWVWPRHTGDFSVFRVYADPTNKPAKYSSENVPYKPLYFLKIALNDRKAGDFTMVYGFPGETEQHVVSDYLQFIMEKERPARIKMRQSALNVINQAMTQSDEIRIKYASKQARIANAHKKWIGQIDGLRRLDAVQVKKQREDEYIKRAKTSPTWNKQYGSIVDEMNQLVSEFSDAELAYAGIIEYLYVGADFLKLAGNLFALKQKMLKNDVTAKQYAQELMDKSPLWFKDYDKTLDKALFIAHSESYFELFYKQNERLNKRENADEIFSKSILVDQEKYTDFLRSFSEKSIKKLDKDPGYAYFERIYMLFINETYPQYNDFNARMNRLLQQYVQGKLEMFPEQKHWPDANGTLRISYGKLEGSNPRDGVNYLEHTTLSGVIDKYYSKEPDFDISPRLLELYKQKKYGDYAQNDELWVCFSASNHTTGGNSGSPVLDANGHLMGLNFDRSWESTMSDYLFDPTRCRNIVVDIRYVLWVMDVYANAGHLVQEMTLIR